MWHVFHVLPFLLSHDTFLSSLGMLRVRICGHWLLSGFISFHLRVQSRRLILIAFFFFILSCRGSHSTTTGVSLILLLLALVLSLGQSMQIFGSGWVGWMRLRGGTFGDHVNGHDTGLVPRGFVANCFASVSLPSWAGSWLLSSISASKPVLCCIVLYCTLHAYGQRRHRGLVRIKFCSFVTLMWTMHR